MPEVLASEKARVYWQRLMEQGFVDEYCHLLPDTSRQQAVLIAELFAEKLAIKTKWKTFEDFWGINNLAQERNKRTELGKLPSRSEDIGAIFDD